MHPPFVGEAARVTYEQDKVRRDGAPLLSTKSSFGDTACRVSLVFDHHLTTTVQRHYKMPEKPVVTTNDGLFPVLAVNMQNQQNSRFYVRLHFLVVVLRCQVPGGRMPSGALKNALQCTFAMRFLV